MKTRKLVRKIKFPKKTQDVDRSFVVIPEVVPDQWRDNLEVFFEEKEAGMDHVRHLLDISKADVDHYDFTGGIDLSQISSKRPDISHRQKTTPITITRLGEVTPVYENTGCFRYAMPR